MPPTVVLVKHRKCLCRQSRGYLEGMYQLRQGYSTAQRRPLRDPPLAAGILCAEEPDGLSLTLGSGAL